MDRSAPPAHGAPALPDVGTHGDAATVPPAAPARQRWRTVFSRTTPPFDRQHRDLAEEWAARIGDAGLSLARPEGRPKPALTFATSLPAGMGAEHEYADISLSERVAGWFLRERLVASVPAELDVLDVFDVWVGAPPLAAVLVAADYRLTLAPPWPDRRALVDAADRLLSQPRVERPRPRGDPTARYDLRPLVAAIDVAPAIDGRDSMPMVLRIRTAFHPERGTGRPEEVVAAVAEVLGEPIGITTITRERLILDERVVQPAERPRGGTRRRPGPSAQAATQ